MNTFDSLRSLSMTGILVGLLASFTCLCQDQESESEKRTGQPINIVNLSLSSVEFKQLLSTLQELQSTQASTLQTSKESLQQVGTSLGNFVDKHKYWLPVTLAGFIYCAFLYKIAHAHRLLTSNESWCNWKQEKSLSQLLALSQKDLAQELITEIQKKYTDTQNPTNFVTPMVNFVNDVNAEIQELESYVKIINSIKTLKLSALYPIMSDEKLSLAQEKINKLAYIKNVFSEWSVEFKQQQLLANTQHNNK